MDGGSWTKTPARGGRLNQERICAKLFLDAPNAKKDRINKSNETDGSPASIFAIRD